MAKLLALVLAALIFHGGAGINFVSFCCVACQSVGLDVVKKGNCCEVHGHSHSKHKNEFVATKTAYSSEACCRMTRMAFDWSAFSVPDFDLQPIALSLFFCLNPVLSTPLFPVTQIISSMSTGPPVACPDIYLSLLTVLLI